MVGQLGLYDGVKDGVREYCLRVIEMVVFSKFSVDMEFLYCIEVCSFLWQCIISMILLMGQKNGLPLSGV